MILTVVSMFTLTGCGNIENMFKFDEIHATASITTSSGDAFVVESMNKQEISVMNQIRWELAKGETAVVDFECLACKNKQKFEISTPWAKTIACDCPEKLDSNGNQREYITIAMSYKKDEKL